MSQKTSCEGWKSQCKPLSTLFMFRWIDLGIIFLHTMTIVLPAPGFREKTFLFASWWTSDSMFDDLSDKQTSLLVWKYFEPEVESWTRRPKMPNIFKFDSISSVKENCHLRVNQPVANVYLFRYKVALVSILRPYTVLHYMALTHLISQSAFKIDC